ncbi:hypothetical protein P0Y35_03530 [Kiritimatiellaeota bacterium B1221]|nr:hypothetical protein [Kiritimatiellaeota bacterium B1221]
MTPLVPLTMFTCLPLILWLFSKNPGRPGFAVIVGFLATFMFLPNHHYPLPLFPDYDKISAAGYAVLLGTAMFHSERFKTVHFSAWDLPIMVWCCVPFFTSISNALGAYDGLNALLGRGIQWGVPYIIGRIYFQDRQSMEALCLGFFVGTLVYIPFCLYEVVMSPRLHKIIYGFHPHDFGQAKRGGGWRPVVFMHHGLMNSMWMVSGFLSGFSLALSGRLKKLLPPLLKPYTLPMLLLLFITILLLKSTGALALLLMGIMVLVFTRITRISLPLRILMILPFLYVTTRSLSIWDGQNLIDGVASIASTERTGSLEYRINNETILTEHAWKRPVLGWGEWKRSFVTNDLGEIVSVPDGLWILAFGKSGYIGLYALIALFFVPPFLFLKNFPTSRWREPEVVAILAAPLLIMLFALDSLLNDMFNPLMLLLAGGLVGLYLNPQAEQSTLSEAVLPPSTPRIF